jgi:hypothetical protein
MRVRGSWIRTGLLGLALVASGVVIFGKGLFLDTRPANVALTVGAEVQGYLLVVTGTADLPDGTVLDVSVVAWEGIGAAKQVKSSAERDVRIEGGKYEETWNVFGWLPADSILVMTTLHPVAAGQPAALADRFGSKGESLAGPGAGVDPDGTRYYQISIEIPAPAPS